MCEAQELTDKVTYLQQQPVIDGILDKKLRFLKKRKFNYFWQFDNPPTKKIPVTYRLGYTPTHLYIYIEVESKFITYNRRGYLWGDGYKVLLGIPKKEGLTDEYYDLAFSPSEDKNYWDRQTISAFNFKQGLKKLSGATQSQEKSYNEKSGFEALISWSDIEPYHPWFLKEIGYNIYFAKAIKNFTNGYAVVQDEGIWDEEISKRNYKPLIFETPKSVNQNFILTKLKRRNIKTGEPIVLQTVSISHKKSKSTINISIASKHTQTSNEKEINIQLNKTLSKKEISLNIDDLTPGQYNLNISSQSEKTIIYEFSILPNINFRLINDKIKQNINNLSIGLTQTLTFKIREIKNNLITLKNYETGFDVFDKWKQFEKDFNLFKIGVDPYKTITTPYRRAFKSKYDNSYQPYTIKLPVNYDANKKYPLLEFLHGSGQDEQTILNKVRSNGEFIELAPFARDKFRAYSSEASQQDIIEAIEDVGKYFSVDSSKIIIGGFSMGGYGALRTFYENPKRYKGIAVFAGHPNLANEWLDGTHPNFLDEKYLTPFKDIPVFIYHGKKDPALPVKLIEQMIQILKNNGAIISERIMNEKAHEYPDNETNNLYFDWMKKVIMN